MSVKIVLPTALARHTEGQKAFDSDAKNLPALIAEFDTKFPALAQNVKDENGKLRRFINVYINDEDIRFLGGDTHQFEDGDEVMLIPSIAGGSSGCQLPVLSSQFSVLSSQFSGVSSQLSALSS